MIIDVPFNYQLTVKMPRARNAIAVGIRDSHPIKIDAAPDAALVAELPYHRYDEENGVPPHTKIYKDGEDFYVAAVLSERGEHANVPITVENYVASIGKREISNYHLPFLEKPSEGWNKKYYDSVEDVGAREIISSERDKEIADLESRASKVRIIDGMMAYKVSEPVHRTTWDSWQGKPYLYVKTDFLNAFGRDGITLGANSLWRLDRFDEMIENFTSRANGDIENALTHKAIVYRPDLLDWNPTKVHFVQSYNQYLESYRNDHHFAGDTVEAFATYAELRDMGSIDFDTSSEAIEKGISLMEHIHTLLPEDTMRYGKPFERVISAYGEYIKENAPRDLDNLSLGM